MEQVVAATQELFFEVAEVLVSGVGRSLELARQTAQQGLALRGQEVFQIGTEGWSRGERWSDRHGPILPASQHPFKS